MSYIPTIWSTGDMITAEKLNHAEEGVATASVLKFTVQHDESTSRSYIDVTWQQIVNAIKAHQSLLFNYTLDEVDGCSTTVEAYFVETDGVYYVDLYIPSGDFITFSSTDPNTYLYEVD